MTFEMSWREEELGICAQAVAISERRPYWSDILGLSVRVEHLVRWDTQINKSFRNLGNGRGIPEFSPSMTFQGLEWCLNPKAFILP